LVTASFICCWLWRDFIIVNSFISITSFRQVSILIFSKTWFWINLAYTAVLIMHIWRQDRGIVMIPVSFRIF
jgi:hypothetical protein